MSGEPVEKSSDPPQLIRSDLMLACLRRLAVPQCWLAVMAVLCFHVQIITRISSAYPLWYIWLISRIRDSVSGGYINTRLIQGKTIVRWMVIYAVVQAALFASFLPPA